MYDYHLRYDQFELLASVPHWFVSLPHGGNATDVVYHTHTYMWSVFLTACLFGLLVFGWLLLLLVVVVPYWSKACESRCKSGQDHVRFQKNRYQARMAVSAACTVLALSAMCVATYVCSIDTTAGLRGFPTAQNRLEGIWANVDLTQDVSQTSAHLIKIISKEKSSSEFLSLSHCPDLTTKQTALIADFHDTAGEVHPLQQATANATECAARVVPANWGDTVEDWLPWWELGNLVYSVTLAALLVSLWFPWSKDKEKRLMFIMIGVSVFAVFVWVLLFAMAKAGSDVCHSPEPHLLERSRKLCGADSVESMQFFMTCHGWDNDNHNHGEKPGPSLHPMSYGVLVQSEMAGNISISFSKFYATVTPPQFEDVMCSETIRELSSFVDTLSAYTRYLTYVLTECTRYAPVYYSLLAGACQGAVVPLANMLVFHLIIMMVVVVLYAVKPQHKDWRTEQAQFQQADLQRLREVVQS